VDCLIDKTAGFAVAMARLSDALGRKTIVCTSFAIFLAASMGCAAASSLDQLIGFRAAQGIGGAGLYSMAMITYPELSPPSKVVIVTSTLGAIVALAGVCGPVLGGLLTKYVGWRYAFWIKYGPLPSFQNENCQRQLSSSNANTNFNGFFSAPCAFVPGFLLLLLWPKDYQLFVNVKMNTLDYFGAVLVLAGTVLPVFIINQAAIRDYAWNSATTISVLIIGGLCWIVFVFWQWHISRNPRFRLLRPQLPFRIMSSRVMMAAILYVCCCCCAFTIFSG
jgi:MFS family permease